MSASQPRVFQAEAATLSGARVENDNAGFTGTGYVDFANASGDFVQWTFDASPGGSHRLDFRYANGSAADRPLELRVNGVVVRPRLSFPPSGNWRTWATVGLDVTLPAGQATVRLTAVGSGGPNLDALTVRPLSAPDVRTLEAETATRAGVTVQSTHSGFTGAGYVDFAQSSGAFVEWSVPVPPGAAGAHALEFRYANGSGSDRPLELRVNGAVAQSRLSFPPTGSWRTWRVASANVTLAGGTNAVRLTAVGSGGPNLDSLTFSARPQPGQPRVRAYHVGNSITDTIRYGALRVMAASRGRDYVFGRHMIPGAPLDWIWEHPDQGFKENPYGYYPSALPDFEWDALTLQPFDRQLQSPDGRGDLTTARKFVDLALPKSPNLQVYVYSRWPQRDGDPATGWSLDYPAKWLRPYTGEWDGTMETRDYFERVTMALRQAYPPPRKPALLVPVGDVLLELDARMKNGQVPGFTDVNQFFTDGIHFNNVGALAVGTTFYATLFRADPRGSDYGGYDVVNNPGDRNITDAQAAAIQDAVWDVVSVHSLAGVAG